jgi:DNA-binding NtrC family response regulator
MARILIAASPEPRAILERILSAHDLCLAESMEDAERCLQERTFDLIVCTIVFDDSKMFDLLRLVKSRREWQAVPFVCARARPYVIRSATALQAAAFTCLELGAAAFLNITDFQLDPEREMREAIESFLDAPVP